MPLKTGIYSGLPLEEVNYLVTTYINHKKRLHLVDAILCHNAMWEVRPIMEHGGPHKNV